MIKLVVSDIDGTLLHGAEMEVAPAIFEEIARLREKGIHFAPASGRQYQSLRRLFAPIANDICHVCENGSIAYAEGNPGAVLRKSVLPAAQTQQLCAEIMALDGVEIVVWGANTSYLCPKEKDLTRRLETFLGNRAATVPSPADVTEDIIKVCLFAHGGITPELEAFRARWGDVFTAVVSGKQWIDFTQSNKSLGVASLCAYLGVDASEVLAIGDNYNDVEMLSYVGHPYLMEGAAPDLKEKFSQRCDSVLELLRTL